MIVTSRALKATCAAACAAVLTVALSACGGSHHAAAASSSPLSSPPASTPAPSPTPTPAPVNPYTGGAPSKNPVVAVKIDDTANGRPQVGIDKADIVYIEQVEGGLTRLLAVFDTNLPTVEAVRSTRASDPELMAQYGPIAYVASGGAPNPLQVLDKSNLKSDINDRGGPGFARDPNRPVPYNLTANLAQIGTTLKSPTAKSIGLTWSGALPGLGGEPLAPTVQTVVGGTPVRFDWNAAMKRYVRVIDGVVQHAADGAVVSTPNVIVQFCPVTVYPQDIDVMGNPSQYTHTIGSGRAVIFRGGHAVGVTWHRATATAGTTLTNAAGQPIPLQPGGAWVVLVATGAALSF